MARISKTIAAFSMFISCFTFASEQEQNAETSVQSPKFQQYQLDAAECVAFYRYGYTSYKRNKHNTTIASKFSALHKFLRKELKQDVGEDDIGELNHIGRANFKAHIQANDHKYAIKVDEYDSELIDLYKHYSPRCEVIIKHYQMAKIEAAN